MTVGGGAALRVCATQAPGFVGLLGEELGGRRYLHGWQLDAVAGADMELLRGLEKRLGRPLQMEIFHNRTAALQQLGGGGGEGSWQCEIAVGGLIASPADCTGASSPCVEYSQPHLQSGVALMHSPIYSQRAAGQGLDLLTVLSSGAYVNVLLALFCAATGVSVLVYGAERWGTRGGQQRNVLSGISKTTSWAFSTLTGVGLGNLPSSLLARVMGMLVSVLSVCLGGVLAGICASDYVEQVLEAPQKHAVTRQDLMGTKLCAREEYYPDVRKLTNLLVRGDSFEDCADKLLRGTVAGVVDDALTVRHYLQQSSRHSLGFLDTDAKYNVAVALKRDASIRHNINDFILQEMASGSLTRTADAFFSVPHVHPSPSMTEKWTILGNEGMITAAAASSGLLLLVWATLSFAKRRNFSKEPRGDGTPRGEEGEEGPDTEANMQHVLSPGVMGSPGTASDILSDNILKALSALMRSNAQLNEKVDSLGSNAASTSTSLKQQKEVTDRVIEKLNALVQQAPRAAADVIPAKEHRPRAGNQASSSTAGSAARGTPGPEMNVERPRAMALRVPKLPSAIGKEGALPPLRAGTGVEPTGYKATNAPNFASYTRDDPDVIRAKYGMSSKVTARTESPADIRRAMMELDDVNLVLSDASSDFSDD